MSAGKKMSLFWAWARKEEKTKIHKMKGKSGTKLFRKMLRNNLSEKYRKDSITKNKGKATKPKARSFNPFGGIK